MSFFIKLSIPLLIMGIGNASAAPIKFGDKYYQIRAMNSDKCLDVKSRSNANRSNIYIYKCHNGSNQGWKITHITGNEYEVIAKHSQRCLDVSSKSRAEGANIHQWECLNLNNQKWIVSKKRTSQGMRYQFKAKHSGKCLANLGRSNQSNVVQKKCVRRVEPSQLWRLKDLAYTGS